MFQKQFESEEQMTDDSDDSGDSDDSDDSHGSDNSDDINDSHNSDSSTVLYLEASVLLEALPNSINPKDPISVKTL